MDRTDHITNQASAAALARKIGITLLVIAIVGIIWIVITTIQLLNDVSNVPLIQYTLSLAQLQPTITTPSGTIELPAYAPLGMAIFLCLMLISGITLLVKALLQAACTLLVPEGIPALKQLRTEIAQLKQNNPTLKNADSSGMTAHDQRM